MRIASVEIDRSQVDEPALIRKAQRGDRPAFGRLVDSYWDLLFRWLYHLSHDRHKAEDLTQETLLKAFAKLRSFQAGGNFQAWLFRIAYNSFLNLRSIEKPQPYSTRDMEMRRVGAQVKELTEPMEKKLKGIARSDGGDMWRVLQAVREARNEVEIVIEKQSRP